jgi:hypothetical protein
VTPGKRHAEHHAVEWLGWLRRIRFGQLKMKVLLALSHRHRSWRLGFGRAADPRLRRPFRRRPRQWPRENKLPVRPVDDIEPAVSARLGRILCVCVRRSDVSPTPASWSRRNPTDRLKAVGERICAAGLRGARITPDWKTRLPVCLIAGVGRRSFSSTCGEAENAARRRRTNASRSFSGTSTSRPRASITPRDRDLSLLREPGGQ